MVKEVPDFTPFLEETAAFQGKTENNPLADMEIFQIFCGKFP